MNLRLCLPAFFLIATGYLQAQHVSCNAITSDMPAPNPATALYWSGHSKEAAARFAELLAEKPGDPELTEGAVRANIELGDVATAQTQAQAAIAAHPESAAAVTAQAELLFRGGRISDADLAFAKATHLDPCYAPARLGIARIAHASSMYAAAQKQLTTAHALNQRDPEIWLGWASTLPAAQRSEELKKLAATLGNTSNLAQQVARSLAFADRQGEGHHCELVSSLDETTIPLSPIMWDATHIDTWGLDTEINGKVARLVLDSGASGLVIGYAFAEHAGIKLEEATLMGGFGDHGPQKSHLGYAEKIKIGKLEFHDCQVEISGRREVVGTSGLIGADVFRRYLVSINYPDHKLQLSQLPARPGAAAHAEGDNLDTSGEQAQTAGAAAAMDRYIAPEMKNFTEAYRFGHLLMVPALVNDIPEGLMVLDTGDGAISLSYEAAKKVTHARIDNVDEFHGMSGRVEKLSAGGDVVFKFGHARAPVADIMVMDHSRMSENIGTEISGFIGAPAMSSLVFQIDYRDGLVNFIYDPKKDAFRKPAPGTECSYCNSGYTK